LTSLLDINVLLALLDQSHVHHSRAKEWVLAQSDFRWASCPLTQNGFIRIITQPAYPGSISLLEARSLLAHACSNDRHEFWADDISLLSEQLFDFTKVHGARQLTDIYLLGLAVNHDGQFVALDRSISVSTVRNATDKHLVVL